MRILLCTSFYFVVFNLISQECLNKGQVLDSVRYYSGFDHLKAHKGIEAILECYVSEQKDETYYETLMLRARLGIFETKFEKASKDLFKSLEYFESQKNQPLLEANANEEIAYLYQRLRQTKLQKDFLDKSINIRVNKLDSLGYNKSLYLIGNYHFYKLYNYSKADSLYKLSLRTSIEKNDSTLYGQILCALGTVTPYLKMPEAFSLSLGYLNESLKVFEANNDQRGKVYSYLALARLYLLVKRPAIAYDHLIQAQVLMSGNFYDAELFSHLNSLLSSIYSDKKDYYNAYHAKVYNYDSALHFTSQISIQNVKEIEEEFKRDKKVLAANARTKLVAVIVGLLLVLIILLFLYFRNRLQKRKLENVKAVLESQENERKRIAQDLHDGVGVLLTGVQRQLDNLESNSTAALEKTTELMSEATQEVRKVAHNMMPGTLTRLGLADALEDLFDRVRMQGKVAIKANIDFGDERFQETGEVMIYRIVQELLNNTLKYAQAKTISFDMSQSEGQVLMSYRDDGQGFDRSQVIEGIGLKSIFTRTDFLSGKLEIDSSRGQGVHFEFRFPTKKLAS